VPAISVIIPTHQRARILRLCLWRLERQTIAEDLEVIVVSDGHDAETATVCTKGNWRIPVRFLEIKKSQQGKARNYGVRMANSPFVLFIGDDILLEPDACEIHLRAHARPSTLPSGKGQTPLSPSGRKGAGDRGLFGVLGYTTWDPVCEITPVMRWLETSGWQFGYPLIRTYAHQFIPTKIQERFTYTSHISLPTEIARRFRFREDVSLYGWEDIEWGTRLKEAGVHLYYEPDAKALHHHHLTLEQSLARMETLGTSLTRISRRSPALRHKLSLLHQWKHRLLSLTPTTSGQHCRAFLRGVWRGKTSEQINQKTSRRS
jgi:GT2 family glycosyltransferase